MNTIYLCGGIHGLSDSQCKSWREIAVTELVGRWHSFNILDPMARDYRGKENESVNEIVVLDKSDIDKSDVILVNASKPSWGTAMEVMYAHGKGKLIVAFTDGAKISPWLTYHATVVTNTLEEGTKAIKRIYGI